MDFFKILCSADKEKIKGYSQNLACPRYTANTQSFLLYKKYKKGHRFANLSNIICLIQQPVLALVWPIGHLRLPIAILLKCFYRSRRIATGKRLQTWFSYKVILC